MNEVWKSIKGYEGLYQVSSLGNVKSLDRKVTSIRGVVQNLKGKHLRFGHGATGGYLFVILSKNGITSNHRVHKLVANSFICETPIGKVVDHIDNNNNNNNALNLQHITQRQNSSKRDRSNLTSKYVGVRVTSDGYYESSIRINGKKKYLYSGKSEYKAHLEYQKELRFIDA